ncbi:MAG: 23S rRNA (adenine(2503)-C(2))-methyltransferase RlmN [Thermodesulfobacteriota bacterium]|nr:23S rRNA (adenine(2503)-C(2))-methyltransferase RlmN [Thermodesulfobacteriota bacterium]
MFDVKDMTIDELQDLVLGLGEDRYRASQIFGWVYQKGATSFDEMTNLSKKLKEKLKKVCYISQLHQVKEENSNDGTRKFLIKLEDGCQIETVLIPESNRLTLCISTQVGCAMGCKFCITGKLGLIRNLKASEILNQICLIRDSLTEKQGISNLVLMGMGEPLANYKNTIKALRIINDPHGLQFSNRKVTISTAGLVPEMERLGSEIEVNLAVSLNATEDDTRDYLMPVNRRYPLNMLLNACRKFPLLPRKRITFEYVLIKGINDDIDDAKRLAKILRGIPCKINIIPFNEHHTSDFKRPDNEAIKNFQQVLLDLNYTSIIRASRGSDILAACGQLGGSLLLH